MRELWELRQMQSLPLSAKVAMTERRIRDWVNEFGTDGVYVSLSGGKDSTVLLHIVRGLYPDVEAVFVNTGLEYPEIQKFVKTFDNVTILRPKMRFDEVIKKHGYPLISKAVSNTISGAKKSISKGQYSLRLLQLGVGREEYGGLHDDGRHNYAATVDGSKFKKTKYRDLLDVDYNVSDMCCDVMKKGPIHEYERRTGKKPILATMAVESMMRESAWLKSGCNAFGNKRPQSAPMSFWTEQDVLQYIKDNRLPIAGVYGDIVYKDADGYEYDMQIADGGKLYTTGCDRTGCIFCAFGCHLEKGESRFERLKKTHPRQYEYCIGGGEYDEDGIWKPNKHGLGMGHVFDELNQIYGDGFIKY